MKACHIVGIILALVLIGVGIFYPLPSKHYFVSSLPFADDWGSQYGNEYVGGDAYNYQIEASLRGGYVSGILTLKSIFIGTGIIILIISIYEHSKSKQSNKVSELLNQIAGNPPETPYQYYNSVPNTQYNAQQNTFEEQQASSVEQANP